LRAATYSTERLEEIGGTKKELREGVPQIRGRKKNYSDDSPK
jgi:hypothetical protein